MARKKRQIREFYNFNSKEVVKHSFLGRDLYHLSTPCPGREITQDSSAFMEISEDVGIILLADGMGGMQSGELISKMAIQEIILTIKGTKKRDNKLATLILDGLEKAHKKIKASGIQGGTTMTICEVTPEHVRFYNIGDSFGLLLGARGSLKYKTIDDSITGLGVESGLLSEEKALTHEDSNVITNALGLDDFRVEISCQLAPSKYDLILLSSDGLSANMTTTTMIEHVAAGSVDSKLSSVTDLAQKIMTNEKAKVNHPDDLTAFLLSYPLDP